MTHPSIESRTGFLEEVAQFTPEYYPSLKTGNYAGKLTITGFIGPAGVCKNALMDVLATDSPDDIHIATGRTSRSRRPTDTSYSYYDLDNLDHREEIRQGLSEGNYIQIISHPTTNEVYCSSPDDYALAKNNLMDVVPGEYYRLQKAQLFDNLSGVYIVAPSYEAWQARWHNRTPAPTAMEYTHRMREAHNSISRCLDDHQLPFIINKNLVPTAQHLRHYFIDGEVWSSQRQTTARNAAHAILKGIIDSGVVAARN